MWSKPSSLLLSLAAGLTLTLTVFASPMEHRLEDIQCRCLSFSTTSAKPTFCTYLESHGLDWTTAYPLASDNALKIQFASQATITKVLEMRRPLPRSVLYAIGNGAAVQLESTNLIQAENKIVCGFGDEARHAGGGGGGGGGGGSHGNELDLSPECHYVGVVLAAFMVLLVVYLGADYAWTRYIAPRQGNIKLKGDEKSLTAARVDTHLNGSAHTDFS